MSEKEKKVSPEEEPLKENADENIKNTLWDRVKYIKSNVTVEPILAGLIIPSMLSRLATQNLNLDKACRVKLDLGDDICNALIEKKGNGSHYEGDIQRVISDIESWRSVIQTAIPTLLVIFMGAWSDRTGNRKLCILLPLFGELCVALCNMISTFYFKEISVEVTMFLESIFPAITGGWVMVYLGVFSYISDITTEESRTFRVGLANLCMTAGVPIGTALSGILLKVWGYYGIFGMSTTIYIINITYAMTCLKSNSKPGCDGNEKKKPPTFKDVITLVKETVAVAFKKRDGNIRMKILVTLAIVTIIYGPNHGERIVTYMYVRYRLNWDALKYSFYSTYSIITHSFGALFSISVFSKRLGFHDSMLCLISIVSKLIGSIYIAFVYTDVQMFLVPIIEILNATTFTSLRSLASKLVPSEESGKMNSLFSLVETLGALMFDPTYSTIYSRTIKIFSGTVFIFSALMTLPAISMLIWIFARHRIETRNKRLDDVEK
ncbi:proton-coupled folate transporter [Amyelois transitella]|uniref:proton-coupled folate transporter n=1 Tax=Amyelois transitella TaxID=680683 RepID=UPI00298FCB67|nr:proton-coupled folate transporter [Amyelois transitella]